MASITLEQANKIIESILKRGAEMDCRPISAVVVEPGCIVKAFQKEDGASMARFEMALGKAYAALALSRSSKLVRIRQEEKPVFMRFLIAQSDDLLFAEGGGMQIRDKDGEVIGAIATTGDINEVDDLCAIAGIRAAGFKTDQDFSEADMRRLNIKRGPPIEDPEKAKPAAQLKRV